MSTVSDSVAAAVREAVAAHLDSIDTAKKAAVAAVRGLDDYPEFVDALVESAVSGMVHDFRHSHNVTLAAQMRAVGTAPVAGAKVNMLASTAVQRVYQSVYSHAIAGRTLGDLTAEDLAKLRDDEGNRARGHQFNADLCAWCLKRVKPGQTVRQAIPEKELERAYKRLRGKAKVPAAVAAA